MASVGVLWDERLCTMDLRSQYLTARVDSDEALVIDSSYLQPCWSMVQVLDGTIMISVKDQILLEFLYCGHDVIQNL